MVSGPAAAVQAFVAGRPTWDRRRILTQESVVVGETLDAGDRARARDLRLDLEPLSLQQVMVHAAGRVTGGLPGKDMRMKTLVNVARYHLVDRFTYIVVPWALLAFVFPVNLIIVDMIPTKPNQHVPVGGLSASTSWCSSWARCSITRSLPFGLSLGVSRRSYFLGTAWVAVARRRLRARAHGRCRSSSAPPAVGEWASTFFGCPTSCTARGT